MDLYKTRLTSNITEEERRKYVFEETVQLINEVEQKANKISFKSSLFGWGNTLLNLTIVMSAAAIVIISAINDFQNVSAIVLGGIIFALSGFTELLKFGSRDYFYRQGTLRLNGIRQQLRNIVYLFHTFSSEEVLAFLTSYQTQIDEIDLDLYKASISGQAKFTNDLQIQDDPVIRRNSFPSDDGDVISHSKRSSDHESENHIHIHIDSPETTIKLQDRNNIEV